MFSIFVPQGHASKIILGFHSTTDAMDVLKTSKPMTVDMETK
jgi:hypothetical protein